MVKLSKNGERTRASRPSTTPLRRDNLPQAEATGRRRNVSQADVPAECVTIRRDATGLALLIDVTRP